MSENPEGAPDGGPKSGAGGWMPIVAFACIVLCLGLMAFLTRSSWMYHSHPYSPVSRVRADMRSVATALESYYVDNNTYPACAVGARGYHASLAKDSCSYAAPTFAICPAKTDPVRMFTVTTPIAYITGYPQDPFANVDGATFAYYSDPQGIGWILYSRGYDGKFDIDPETDYDVTQCNPTPALFAKTYDPTNGLNSGGDIWRVKQ